MAYRPRPKATGDALESCTPRKVPAEALDGTFRYLRLERIAREQVRDRVEELADSVTDAVHCVLLITVVADVD